MLPLRRPVRDFILTRVLQPPRWKLHEDKTDFARVRDTVLFGTSASRSANLLPLYPFG
ncbi:hypothetical protein HRbin30_00099 [bacterium HR30]|nr:hypothetical protein HRbin30_00099 [bacterium HR30]